MVNPLLAPSTLPYGLPDFARLGVAEYREAIQAGMESSLAAVREVIANPEPPTFDNTIAALERASVDLDRALAAFYTVVPAHGTDEIRDLRRELSPALSAHSDQIWMDPALFGRINEVATNGAGELAEDAAYLTSRYQLTARLAGAELPEEDRAELSSINTEIARLRNEFSDRLLADTNDLAVHFDTAEQLDGLSQEELDLCADAATEAGLDGYVVALVNTTVHPYLAVLTNRESRQRLYEATAQRGNRNNEWDTKEIVTELVSLRARRAALLGFATHAHLKTADQTVKSPTVIRERIWPLAEPALANMYREAEALQQLINDRAHQSGEQTFELAPWDWAFYTELLQQQTFDLDSAELRPYFELDAVLHQGVFHAATQLYGITFQQRDDLGGYHPDVRVYEVFNEDGSGLGLLLYDPFARPTKQGGAWMNSPVSQSRMLGAAPVVCQNLNLPKPREGAPVLLTLDNLRTAFHEFGHALHGLLSDVYWPSQSGTSVPRDFVEYPSQVNELWITWPSVLANYARHQQTGEPLPADLAAKLSALGTFNQGFSTTEYLGAALLDQELHALADGEQIDDLERWTEQALDRIGLANPYVAPRYRPWYFSHIFANNYDGAYYSYLWSEILDADTSDWFTSNGGLDRALGQKFRDELLSRGDSRDPMTSVAAVLGRQPDITPLLVRRGLLTADA